MLFALCEADAATPQVVQRGTAVSAAAAPGAARPATAARLPSIRTSATPAAETPAEIPAAAEETPAAAQITTTDFSEMFSGQPGAIERGNSALAEQIRAQRALIDSDASSSQAKETAAALSAGTGNACDRDLRKCMQDRCGNDFSKCAGDGDTVWGDRIESCGRTTKCSGRELSVFAAEIKADRDASALLAGYNEIMTCGARFNQCMLDRCGGAGFRKCLSRSGEDAAINACRARAEECRTADSGLQPRARELLAALRVQAESDAVKWEQQLYAMRDEMRGECRMIGGIFDDRSLQCMFTVEMFAKDIEGPAASRVLASGLSYMCTPEWFGVDIMTYMENAARYEREQQGAINAFMGAGLGTAAGMVASGAISRAMNTQKAQNAVKAAEVKPAAEIPQVTSMEKLAETETPSVEPQTNDNAKVLKTINASQINENGSPDNSDLPDETESVPTPEPKPYSSELPKTDCYILVDKKEKEQTGFSINEKHLLEGDRGLKCARKGEWQPFCMQNGNEFEAGDSVDCNNGKDICTAQGWTGCIPKLINISSDTLFESGQFTLKSAVTQTLDNVKTSLENAIKAAKSNSTSICFVIIGHTDRTAVKPNIFFNTNQELSLKRAMTVRDYIRLNATNSIIIGKGEQECTLQGDQPSCRKVEIRTEFQNCDFVSPTSYAVQTSAPAPPPNNKETAQSSTDANGL